MELAKKGITEVISRGILLEQGRVLLCRSVKDGYAYLPGGHIEFGEPAIAALRREYLEECGIELGQGHLVAITEELFEGPKRVHHEVNLVFHVERKGLFGLEPPRTREPKILFEWIPLAECGSTDIRPATIVSLLSNYSPSRTLCFMSGIATTPKGEHRRADV